MIEAANARQEQVKKRSLCVINEHSEPVFNSRSGNADNFSTPVNEKTRKHTYPVTQPSNRRVTIQPYLTRRLIILSFRAVARNLERLLMRPK
ncbi:MAG TPA: hypothetical protein PKY85_07870, partial [Nitrosomonas sp.]|nr:hypothetical protein [Nitrosomonas sp.]